MPQDIKEPQNPVDFPAHALADITFDNISFTYPGDENNAVFESLSFSVKAGERVALVGPSGAGKSTVFGLLQRFFDVDSGSILLDGIAINDLSLDALRKQFALVPQESVIFATSVLENVRYGDLMPASKRLLRRVSRRAPMTLSLSCLKATPQNWESGAFGFPAGKSNVSPLPVPSWQTGLFSCWMKRPAHWMRLASTKSKLRSIP